MAQTLKSILKSKEKSHEYRVKFACDPHTGMLQALEIFLAKYDLINMGSVKKTIFQSRPMDFEHLDAGEIWMVDVELGRGLSSGYALQEMAKALFTSEDLIRIRGKFEPAQMDAEVDEDGIELDEYIVKLEDTDYTSDALEFNADDIAGDARAIESAKEASSFETNAKYTEYMFAGYGK